ncbi:TRM11 family SAM-dependent methyltransferase [Paenibacillus lutrae]|uniref:RNA methyltransferase n=1 Tax=Paenibacillus lutrae TaxID=2078573 RepID=A0A7X3FLP4_9BACL|nr:RsmD family RNA methyltransferase [Paenibacillus lutrae]MVP01950.1 RNA methyltransferase [Paenibacillus lutrae]
MELRALFGSEPESPRFTRSTARLDPSRSPFIRFRVAAQLEAASLDELAAKAESLDLQGETFKLQYVEAEGEASYDEQRAIERAVGLHVRGKADMKTPQRLLGLAQAGGRWLLGECRRSEALWLAHSRKPRQYSTALSTRVARAAANIAVPRPAGIRAIDPCCGIGTVLVEALSMGIDIVGRDLNPLAVRGARENLHHFGFPDVVKIADIRSLEGDYDALILDMPYNLCSRISAEEQLDMLRSARRLARRAVVITAEPIDGPLAQAGFEVDDRCVVRKGSFERQVILCRPKL